MGMNILESKLELLRHSLEFPIDSRGSFGNWCASAYKLPGLYF